MTIEHSRIPDGGMHHPYNWIVNDEQERLALPVTADDIHKLCLQEDLDVTYKLNQVSPTVVWKPINILVEIDGGTF